MSISKTLIKGATLRTSTVVRPSVPVAPAAAVNKVNGDEPPRRPATSVAVPAASMVLDTAELESLREIAQKEGFAVGMQQAKAEADRMLQEKLSALNRLMNSISQAYENECRRREDQLVDFAFVASCRILGDALKDKKMVASLVRQTLKASDAWSQMTLELHPRDVEAVSLVFGLGGSEETKNIRFVPSSSVTLGGCRATADNGVLDARLEVQLALLRDSLDAARES